MNVFPGVWTDIRQAIKAIWPESGMNMRVIQAQRLNWSNLIEQGVIVSPYIVVHIPPYVSDPSWGLGNLVYRLNIGLYYIAANSASTDIGAFLEERCKSMHDYLRSEPDPFAAMQVLDEGYVVDVAETNEVTRSMEQANMPFTGGCVQFVAITGEAPSA